jgi:hypothetical protein
MSKNTDNQMELLARLGKLALNREDLVRQIQNLDQESNQLKLRLFLLDSNRGKSNGE